MAMITMIMLLMLLAVYAFESNFDYDVSIQAWTRHCLVVWHNHCPGWYFHIFLNIYHQHLHHHHHHQHHHRHHHHRHDQGDNLGGNSHRPHACNRLPPSGEKKFHQVCQNNQKQYFTKQQPSHQNIIHISSVEPHQLPHPARLARGEPRRPRGRWSDN